MELTSAQARWVSKKIWHSDQQGEFQPDGTYRLRVPFSDPTELTMNILRHVPTVKVISHPSLQQRILNALRAYMAENSPA